MKLRRFLYLAAAFVLVMLKFAIDVISKNVALEIGGLSILRELFAAAVFILLYLSIDSLFPRGNVNPVRRLGVLVVVSLVSLLAAVALSSLPANGFDAKELSLIPLDYPTLFVASLLGIVQGIFAIVLLRALADLLLLMRRKGTLRNFRILLGLILATAGTAVVLRPLESGVLNSILFSLAVLYAIITSFRMPWIVYLGKREKVLNLVFSFLLFIILLALNLYSTLDLTVSRSIAYYSHPLQEFVRLSQIFGAIYAGMAFVSTLFHLPTAEAFDRKRSEISSVHTLSKLITQVFDFDELVETVMSMTMQVCEARSSWLEIVQVQEEDESAPVRSADALRLAGMKNIGPVEIDALHEAGMRRLRDAVLAERRPIVVDDLRADDRFPALRRTKAISGSLVVVPLLSHAGPLGVLYAIKDAPYGFVRDDVDVISTFADQATVAIENSRLIEKSIERQRLMREMALAQEMQRKLLPQRVPSFPTVDIDAVSTPAFEVGGDYYDFMMLDPDRLGIVVGDVSGKGVPAAFYMSEVKGIFQSLSRMHESPRTFLIGANDVLRESIDKHSFVSLIYVILDVRTGMLRLSRAGHCPMLLVSGERAAYVRPDGMGLGLGDGVVFGDAIQEQAIQLQPGDVCVLYTDGVTEAHRDGEEYGYERLLAAAQRSHAKPAAGIKDDILAGVSAFIDHQANHDDLTVVVIKWLGPVSQPASAISQSGGRVHE